MTLKTRYIFELSGGFAFVRDNPQDILKIFDENKAELELMAEESPGRVECSSFLDITNELFPKGHITIKIDGEYKFYELRTETEIINI